MNIVQAKGTRELGSMNGNTGSQIYSPGLHLFEVVDHCTPFWIIPVHSSIAVHGSHLVCLSMYWFYSCQQRQTVRDAVRKTDLCVAGCKMKAGFKDGFGGIYWCRLLSGHGARREHVDGRCSWCDPTGAWSLCFFCFCFHDGFPWHLTENCYRWRSTTNPYHKALMSRLQG